MIGIVIILVHTHMLAFLWGQWCGFRAIRKEAIENNAGEWRVDGIKKNGRPVIAFYWFDQNPKEPDP